MVTEDFVFKMLRLWIGSCSADLCKSEDGSLMMCPWEKHCPPYFLCVDIEVCGEINGRRSTLDIFLPMTAIWCFVSRSGKLTLTLPDVDN